MDAQFVFNTLVTAFLLVLAWVNIDLQKQVEKLRNTWAVTTSAKNAKQGHTHVVPPRDEMG